MINPSIISQHIIPKTPASILSIIKESFHMKQKNCSILAMNQLPSNFRKTNSEEIDYFKVVFFLPKSVMKTCNFFPDNFLTQAMPSIHPLVNRMETSFSFHNNKFSMGNYMETDKSTGMSKSAGMIFDIKFILSKSFTLYPLRYTCQLFFSKMCENFPLHRI